MYLNRQAGVSLVSLLIGVFISVVALLGMLTLYGSTVKSTIGSTRDARTAGERSLALLVASVQLQGAGYGIDEIKRSSDLLLLAGVTLDRGGKNLSGGTVVSGEGDGNTLIWIAEIDGSTLCSGLHAPSETKIGGLYLLRPRLCTTPNIAGTWDVQPLIVDNSDAVDSRLHMTLSLIEHESSGCSVMGITGLGKVSIRLSMKDRNTNQLDTTTCLVNFKI